MDAILYDWHLTDSCPLNVQYFVCQPGQRSLPEDMHSAVHVTIVLDGDFTGQCSREIYSILPGGVALTAPWEPHRRLSSEKGNKLLMLTAAPDAVNRVILRGADKLNLLYRTPFSERQMILNRLKLDPKLPQTILELLATPDTPERELRLWHAALGIFIEIATLDFSADPDPDYPRLLPALQRLGNQPLTVPEAAGLCGLSESRFAHLFSRVFGMPFARYERLFRLRCAVEEMNRLHSGLKETAENWGFYDKSHFAKAVKKYLGGSGR